MICTGLHVINNLSYFQQFLILYKELYYRHIHARGQPTLEHRIKSFYNYCDLLNYILSKLNVIDNFY